MARRPAKRTPRNVDYIDDDFNERSGTVSERNGNLSWVEDRETGEGSWRAPFEINE